MIKSNVGKIIMLSTNKPTQITQSITSKKLFYNNSLDIAKRHMEF